MQDNGVDEEEAIEDVAQKYDIAVVDVRGIIIEGIINGWPMPTPTPTPTPSPEVAQIGDWISDERISVCVNSFRYVNIIYGEYPEYTWDEEIPKTGNVFVIVDASIKNVGSEIISVNPLYVYLTDTNDYQYERNGGATGNLDKGIKLIDLTPGRTLRFEVVFEIPKDAEPKEFIWDDWSSVSVIQLQK